MRILCKIKSLFGGSDASAAPGVQLFSEDEKAIATKIDSKIVIGLIEQITAHPDPKVTKVRVTQVNIGGGKTEQVLCGGSNIRENQLGPVATVGADLGEGFIIGEREIRGEVSRGMICSRTELGLPDQDETKGGIWELPEDFRGVIGTSLNSLV